MAKNEDALVYPHERTLGTITLVLGLFVWLLIVVGTIGIALVYLLFVFVFYLFAQSALISWVRGNGVLLSQAQLPDLRAKFDAACERLGLADKDRPDAYLLQGNGVLNAFATRFLGHQYVVLLSDVVDAMSGHPDGVSFYVGHELGHVRMRHLTGRLFRLPVLWLPLVGAAYSRAKESTCDRHGAACCSSPQNAARAIAALAAGPERWKQVDLGAFAAQATLSRGFWMSYHELTGSYPWLTKRVARVLDPAVKLPSRHPLAWGLAAITPYAGPAGGGAGLLVLIAVIGIVAATAIPAYRDYQARAALGVAYEAAEPARDALADYYATKKETPSSLEAAGVTSTLPGGTTLSLDADSMVLTVETPHGGLVFTPDEDEGGKITWQCAPALGTRPSAAPPQCRDESASGPFGMPGR